MNRALWLAVAILTVVAVDSVSARRNNGRRRRTTHHTTHASRAHTTNPHSQPTNQPATQAPTTIASQLTKSTSHQPFGGLTILAAELRGFKEAAKHCKLTAYMMMIGREETTRLVATLPVDDAANFE